MKKHAVFFAAIILSILTTAAQAQIPPVALSTHEALLASPDPKLARNKKIVYDFWREVVEAGHTELIDKYVTEGYIQHNPNLATGRAALVESIAKNVKQQPIQPRVNAPLVAIVAEGNLVTVCIIAETPDPQDPSKKHSTTWFDMFRLDGGKIIEHWDGAQKM